MLTMNYQGMSQGTIRPVPSKQVVARNKKWGWRKQSSKPGPVVVTRYPVQQPA